MGKPQLPDPGDLFAGKYRVERELRRPETGAAVFEAVDVALARPVALKIMLGLETAEVMQRFVRDAKVMATLESEHVVKVYEVGTSPEGVPFIAMELLHGKSLADELAVRGRLPVSDACDVVLEACEALAEAHKRGIVLRHLDIDRVYLATQGDRIVTKVLELGAAASVEEAMRAADARTDVRALARLLSELLVGEPLEPPSTPIRNRVHDVPSEVEALLVRAASGERSRRFPSVMEFAKELAPFAGPRGEVATERLFETMSRPSLAEIAVAVRTPPPTPAPSRGLIRSSTRPSARPPPKSSGLSSKPPKFEESRKGGNPGVWLFVVASAGIVLVLVGVGGVVAGKALREDVPSATAGLPVPPASQWPRPVPLVDAGRDASKP